jgi:PII-like signaling protein
MKMREEEQTLLRIFIGESDHWHQRPLHLALLELFRHEGLSGATVLRGVSGFGASSVVHTDQLLSLSHDLPLVVEVVDSAAAINAVLPRLDEMLQSGLVTLEKVRAIHYGK